MKREVGIYGVVAEFESAQALVDATYAAKKAGYNDIEAYSPFPIEMLTDIIGFKTKLPAIVLGAGLTGGMTGFGMCFFANAIHYPADHRRQAAQRLAGLDSHHLRVDDSLCRDLCGRGHARSQRVPSALPPAVQSPALRSSDARQVLSLHRE
jgi:hypothetical protein